VVYKKHGWGFDIKSKAAAVLEENPDKRFTAKEIANKIYSKYTDECEQKKEASDKLRTKPELIQQLTREVGATWRTIVERNERISTLETRPRLFFYSSTMKFSDIIDINIPDDLEPTRDILDDTIAEEIPADQKLLEKDLYPLLGEYLFHSLSCWAMRIDEGKGSNKRGSGGNHWLYPDAVGIVGLQKNWNASIKSTSELFHPAKAHLYSFEVKRSIGVSNIRQSAFQTISNSSWANYGYLVAADLDSKAREELDLLCASHGIGFILLDINNPSDSQILIPAMFHEKINWDGLSRLADENKDAVEFVNNVKDFCSSNHPNESRWDLIPDNESD